MEAMIQNDEEKEWMQPLLDIRNDLDVQDDRDRRDSRRLAMSNFSSAMWMAKFPLNRFLPYTKEWRETWLRRVLTAQTEIRRTGPVGVRDITLITPEELSEIRRIWRKNTNLMTACPASTA